MIACLPSMLFFLSALTLYILSKDSKRSKSGKAVLEIWTLVFGFIGIVFLCLASMGV